MFGVGDVLDGSTISYLYYDTYGGGLNDVGQPVFVAALADGRQGLFVATPVPEPIDLLALAAVTAAGVHLRRRRRS